MRAGIALGSNLGDRKAYLNFAVEQLRTLTCCPSSFLVSPYYEFEAVDRPPGAPNFLNAAVDMESDQDPLQLLKALQAIEQQAGRPQAHAFHAPRTLDLDLLYCDDWVIQSPELILPHPRITQRLFVLIPLRDLVPLKILDGHPLTIEELLKQRMTL